MKRFLCLGLSLCLISLETPGLAQENRILSLPKQQTPTAPQGANEAQKLFQEGVALFGQGTPEAWREAIAKFEQSLPLIRAAKITPAEAAVLGWLGLIYHRLNETQKAREYYQQALPLFTQLGDRTGQGRILTGLASVYDALGNQQQALATYTQALPILREIGNKEVEANTLHAIGFIYDRLGLKQKALDYYNQALPILQQIGLKLGEARTLTSIAGVYNILGDNQTSLDYYDRALAIYRQNTDKIGEASILTSIGLIYNSLGEQQTALDYYQNALTLQRQEGDKLGEAVTINNIGGVYYLMNDLAKALEYYQQSLTLNQQIGNRVREANVLNNIASLLMLDHKEEKALEIYQQALLIQTQMGSLDGQARILHNIGRVYHNQGQFTEALGYYDRAFSLNQKVGDRAGEALILYHQADLKRRQNNLTQALALVEKAITIVESLRSKIVSPQLRTSYFATVQDYYELYINILMERGRQNPQSGDNQKAFEVSERAKARTLLELLTEANVNIRQGVDTKLLEQEKDLQDRLNALEQNRIELLNNQPPNSQSSTEELKRIEQEQQMLLTQSQELASKIRTQSPKYAALKYPQPLTLEQIQNQVLDDNTLLLAYFLSSQRSYLWLVGKNEFSSYELPPQKDIEEVVKSFRRRLTNSNLTADRFSAEAIALSQIILQPVLAKLGNKRLLIVPDGILQNIPFAALTTELTESNTYKPLISDHEIVHLPSASILASLRQDTKNRPPAPKTLAIFADPVFDRQDTRITGGGNSFSIASLPLEMRQMERSAQNAGVKWERLPGTRQEAEDLLALVPETNRQVFLDFQANKQTATSNQLSQYRFIHFATHGFANSSQPELSGVVLSLVDNKGSFQNGFLRLTDIFNLNLRADLVVMSACQTGLGELVWGEGLIGLTRGFMYAGAPRVVTSLWNVSDQKTAQLMTLFYQNMLQKKMGTAAALRSAQLTMIAENGGWLAPYFWSAFTLQGEWQ